MDIKIIWQKDKAGILPLIPSPDQEMLPARNLIGTHAQVSVAYDRLLLPTPNESAHFTRHYKLLEKLDGF
jgi:hypothetical protein